MLLVPRQLARPGMTGNVPYYGGRFSPAQAYAVSHPPSPQAPPPQSPPPTSPAPDPAQALEALDHLRETGVVTEEEYGELRRRLDQAT
jgi:hypothetical protein